MTAVNEVDVVVIGSGFGGSVAALRFAQAGHRVLVLERGSHVARDEFRVDLGALWRPHRGTYGMHDLSFRGRNIIPWVGAAVGGGSHVFAGTLKRRDSFDDFPAPIRTSSMDPYNQRVEDMLAGTPYPDYAPYDAVRATRLMFAAGKRLKSSDPELVEDYGPVHLAISFAPRGDHGGRRGAEHGAGPGDVFINKHGCEQRYYDPREQSILGGDIDSKNSLDRNYLYLAQKAGAQIHALCEADKLERLADGRWQVTYRRHLPLRGWARFRQRWLTRRPGRPMGPPETVIARRVVLAAGSVGSTELLLRNRDVHRTLTTLSPTLGTRYTTNGNCLSFVIPFRFLVPVWLAFAAMVVCGAMHLWAGAGLAAFIYYLGLLGSGPPHDPDLGTTNSDNMRFFGPAGESQYAYIESGRYPTPGRAFLAILISAVTGRFHRKAYRSVVVVSNLLRFLVPPFGALARSFPIPLLTMGRDRAYGRFRLDPDQRAVIDYDLDANSTFYTYLDSLGRKVAAAADAYWLPNPSYRWFKKQEVPHNQGGVPMGDDAATGVVDHAGRVFGEPDLLVLDGSIIPESIGPNPALTIAAVAERAMDVVLAQLAVGNTVIADAPPVPAAVARAASQ